MEANYHFSHVSEVEITYEQTIIYKFRPYTHEKTIFCWQLFAGHVVRFWPMERKKMHRGQFVIVVHVASAVAKPKGLFCHKARQFYPPM